MKPEHSPSNVLEGVAVLILARNEEHNIVECLKSVAWADERIVVDSGSKDHTVERAIPLATQVLQLPWRGFGETKNDALAYTRRSWVLWLDADERITPEGGEEIRTIVRSPSQPFAAYEVARRAYFLGTWIRHCGWYPSRVTRLFRRSAGTFSRSSVHEHLEIDGPIGRLHNDILHYTDPDLYHYFAKFNRYTSLAAVDMKARGRRAGVPDLLFRPPFMFLKMYVLRLGFLDGMHGFLLSLASSAYVFAKYAKLWESLRDKEPL